MSQNSHFPNLPLFEIEGEKYTFKRLGHKHVFMLLGMGKDLWSLGMGDFKMRMERFQEFSENTQSLSQDLLLQMSLLFGLEYMKANLDEFLLSILRRVDPDKGQVEVTQAHLDDENKFPASSLPSMLFEIVKHPDIGMFVSAFSKGADIPFFQKLKQQTTPESSPNI